MKKLLCIIMSAALVICCTACGGTTKKEKFSASFLDLFDTASTVIAYDKSQEDFDKNYKKFYEELQRYDHLFDIYHSYEGINNLYTVNKNAAKSPVKVSSSIIELLQYGKTIYQLSDGKTNICYGTVLKLWHNERELSKENSGAAKLPDMNELKKASKHTNIEDLVIDREERTVYFKDPEMQLDVGAIAKGFAVEKISEWSRQNVWKSAAISIGGNVSTYGFKNEDGKTLWTIGIENPDTSANDYLLKVNITDLSVVTSGDYQRYYTVDGKKYCHIINPETLMPSEYMASVSVICDDSSLGDALSTTLFNMSIEDGQKLVEKLNGVEAVWVDKKYHKTFSNGFEQYIDKK